MNLDSLKIILNQRNFIPEVYKTETSYLSFENVYNLSSTSKNVRFQIENFCKNVCRNFEDFNEIKIKKYKTWFNCLLFWNCKLPSIIIRNLVDKNDNNKYGTFISMKDHLSYELTSYGIPIDKIGIFPCVEYHVYKVPEQIKRTTESSGSAGRSKSENVRRKKMIEMKSLMKWGYKTKAISPNKKFIKSDIPDLSDDFDDINILCEFVKSGEFVKLVYRISENDKEILRKIELPTSDEKDYDLHVRYLASKGIFRLNLEKLFEEIIRIPRFTEFFIGEDNGEDLLKLKNSILDVGKNKKVTISQKMKEMMENVCILYSIEPKIENFIELYKNKKFIWYDDEESCNPDFKF